jgi:hypothetical protein
MTEAKRAAPVERDPLHLNHDQRSSDSSPATGNQPHRYQGGARQRRKGNRFERGIVERNKSFGTHCERYPFSDASRHRESGHIGLHHAPLVSEVKGCTLGSIGRALDLIADWDGHA